MRCGRGLAVPAVVAGLAISSPARAIEPTLESTVEAGNRTPSHMAESLRSSLRNVVVLPTGSPGGREITGSYREETSGFAGGMAKGSEIGKGVGTDIGGIPVRIPIPILTLPGAIVGGVSGATKREIQEFRDRLTADLAQAASQPLSNDSLASDVFWRLRDIPSIDSKVLTLSAPVPEETDAILYVSLEGVTIDVQGKDAVITTTARATLRRVSDGTDLDAREVRYQDRDTLAKWTEDDNALWREYANFARYYIGREIAAEMFGRIALDRELKPLPNKTVKRAGKNDWHGVSRTSRPTLSWQLITLPGDAAYGRWADAPSTADISFDIEVFDRRRPVYSATGISGSEHAIAEELQRCETYRWSVRPVYRIDGDIRYGDWMRFEADAESGNGNVGRKASDAPAYTQDFARLEIDCGRT